MLAECLFSTAVALSGISSPGSSNGFLEPLLLLGYAYMHSVPEEVHSTLIEIPDNTFDAEIPSHKDRDHLITDLSDDEAVDYLSCADSDEYAYEIKAEIINPRRCRSYKIVWLDGYDHYVRQCPSDGGGADASGETGSGADSSENNSSENNTSENNVTIQHPCRFCRDKIFWL